VSKLNADGTTLLYSTYLGGARTDSGASIAVDKSGNAYITGSALGGLPVRGKAFQAMAGDTSAFVSKLNATGTALVYSIYVGGNVNSQGMGIAIDAGGNAYVTGISAAGVPAAATSAFTTGTSAAGGAFVCKVNAVGDSLLYCAYLGSGDNAGEGIAVDGSGNTYIVGYTDGPGFPTTTDAVQQKVNPAYHAFVSALSATGSRLLYSTYLGGSVGEGGQAIALDNHGGIYVTGNTNSRDFLTLAGGFHTSFAGGNRDAFVGKFTLPVKPNPGDVTPSPTTIPGPTPVNTPENGVHD
jgi:hypothetical protein